MRITILSYNISQSRYIWNQLVSYISKKKNVVVMLQECPKTRAVCALNNLGFKSFVQKTRAGDLVMLVSSDIYTLHSNITVLSSNHSYQRIKINGVDIVNVHMNARSAKKDRDDKYKENISIIRANIGDNAVVGGDFNENPFDTLMTIPTGWFAKRTFIEIQSNSQNGFVNPFWHLIRKRFKDVPSGTIEADETEPMSMAIFDQFILKQTLCRKIKSYGLLNKLGNMSISTLNQNANQQKRYMRGKKDRHWPVYITLDI